jgi:hypothetical protein
MDRAGVDMQVLSAFPQLPHGPDGAAAAPRDISRDRRYPANRACRGTLTGASERVAAPGSCVPAGLETAAPRQMPDQKQRQWWLGTKWESRALVSALCRSGLLTCARLQLRKHGSRLVAGIGMHSWGSRGRRFMSDRPDWSEPHFAGPPCHPATSSGPPTPTLTGSASPARCAQPAAPPPPTRDFPSGAG